MIYALKKILIAQELYFKKIAEAVFDQEAELHMIDSYLSKKSDEFIVPWHNDIGYKEISNKEMFFNAAELTIKQKKK